MGGGGEFCTQAITKSPQPELVNLVFFRQTESAVTSTRLLGQGWKMYPSDMQRMLNKDLPRFIQSLSWARQNRASDRKVLLAGLTST